MNSGDQTWEMKRRGIDKRKKSVEAFEVRGPVTEVVATPRGPKSKAIYRISRRRRVFSTGCVAQFLPFRAE